MKKIKPIYIVLIAILVVEIVVFGVILLVKKDNKPSNSIVTKDTVELTLAYDTDENETYTLSSLFDNAVCPTFTFSPVNADAELTFDGNIAQLADCYTSYDTFLELYPNTDKNTWEAYKKAVDTAVADAVNIEHPAMTDVRTMATGTYNVPMQSVQSVRGLYTIHASAALADWAAAFDKYRVTVDETILNEIALEARVVIGDDTYSALAYMVAPEAGDNNVNFHFLFGSEPINDINATTADIYILSPVDGTAISHSQIKLSFVAQSIEARYRDLIA